ncbi:MAG: YdeI/OmpD-associated family protein [Chloroflexota bacterium]
MSTIHTFTAIIQHTDEGGGAYVEIPFDVEAAFGSKRPKVKAWIEGVEYRGTLVRTPALPGTARDLLGKSGRCAPGASVGTEFHILGIRKEIREQVGKTFGDEIQLTVEADLEERVVEVPPGLAAELKRDPQAAAIFDKLSYTHKREYVTWIDEAKKAETRQARILKTIQMLKQGKQTR